MGTTIEMRSYVFPTGQVLGNVYHTTERKWRLIIFRALRNVQPSFWGNFGRVRFPVVCLLYKVNPNPRNIFFVGKNGPNATFILILLGLGWPWVGEFVRLTKINLRLGCVGHVSAIEKSDSF